MSELGILSILPTIIVFVLAIITKKTTFSLVVGTLFASVLLSGWSFGKKWVEALYGVMRSDLWIWVVLVCGFFGSLVLLLEKSGGIFGFDMILTMLCRGKRSTMVTAWVMGILLFLDDWLSILTNGNAMKRMADRHHIPREMLAYTCNTMASSACVIVPISTWGVFMLSLLMSSGLVESGNEVAGFFGVVRFMIYPFAALICCLLFSLKVIPVFGPMRAAWKREEAPSEKMHDADDKEKKATNPLNFLIPMAVVIVISVITGEILYGALIGIAVCGAVYLPQKFMTVSEYFENIIKGFITMVPLVFIMTSAFMLRDLNDMMNMPEYIIGVAAKGLSPVILPAFSFIIVLLLGIGAANFWGVCAIAFPVIMPIAQAVGADLVLTAGAIISGTAASSQRCFYGSEAVLTCQTTEVEGIQYFRTAGTLMILPAAVSAVVYVILGLVI